MVNYLPTALVVFRRRYGVAADPERFPREWAAVLAEVHDALTEAQDDDKGPTHADDCGLGLGYPACTCGTEDNP